MTALALSLVAAEWIVRIAGEPPSGGAAAVLTEYDPLLGWRKIPNATGTLAGREYEITEVINSRGIRGPEYPVEKPAGEHRILALGDSFAEGYTVEFEELFSEQLESRLRRRGHHRTEVINAGTAGYSTDQELLFFEEQGAAYRPDLTILLFYVNDVLYNTRTRYWRGFKPRFVEGGAGLELSNVPVPEPDPGVYPFQVPGGTGLGALARRVDGWLGSHSALYRRLRAGIRGTPWLHALTIRWGLAAVPLEYRPWSRVGDPDLEEAWRITESLLARLRDAVRTAGSELLVFHVPSRPAVYPEDWHTTKRTYAMDDADWSPEQDAVVLAEICARQRLDCLFPLERFRSEARSLALSGRRLYFVSDDHWTAVGHRLAGAVLAERIERAQSGAR